LREIYFKKEAREREKNGGERAKEKKRKSENHCSVHKQRTGRRIRAKEKEKKREDLLHGPAISSTFTWNENDKQTLISSTRSKKNKKRLRESLFGQLILTCNTQCTNPIFSIVFRCCRHSVNCMMAVNPFADFTRCWFTCFDFISC